MPLAFDSINRGLTAFGFFNIDSDLLLLDHYFFFAQPFCENVSDLAQRHLADTEEVFWDVYTIERRENIGDLMAAIHGVDHRGFIGEIYKRFPFPQKEDDFKQKPDGWQNRGVVTDILERSAQTARIPLRLDRLNRTISIGEFLFSEEVFRALIDYVWLGGYPRWKDGVRPEYVLRMKKKLDESRNWLFSGLRLS
jgi:hypothetical protein